MRELSQSRMRGSDQRGRRRTRVASLTLSEDGATKNEEVVNGDKDRDG